MHERAVQLEVHGLDGETYLGTGCIVASGVVLTSAHVLRGAASVAVVLDLQNGRSSVFQARSWWLPSDDAADLDIAVVVLERTEATLLVTPARFARVGDVGSDAVLDTVCIGFPISKLMDGQGGRPFRDTAVVRAQSPVGANRRSRTLSLDILGGAPAALPPPASHLMRSTSRDGGNTSKDPQSAWEGISGAAVWCDGMIVGVVAVQRPMEGPEHLVAHRIDAIYTKLRGDDLEHARNLLGLPPEMETLPDVTPRSVGDVIRSAYYRTALDLAPQTLVDREPELAEWSAFAASQDGPQVGWWRAPPWAGKSALAAWFVTHPPSGCDVVSFFVMRRRGVNTFRDFHTHLADQLQHLSPRGVDLGQTSADYERTRDLFIETARHLHSIGRTLVLVIDGLDEDAAGAHPELTSIAAQIPAGVPHMKTIITGRLNPPVPVDVDEFHPLRDRANWHTLAASEAAREIQRVAEQNLVDLLADRQGRFIAGLLAAARGGLTIHDLEELGSGELDRVDILRVLASGPARALAPKDAAASTDAMAFTFAHDLLLETAVESLGRSLQESRGLIHRWIEGYANRGWPDDTPVYASEEYFASLSSDRDAVRMVSLARDSARRRYLVTVLGTMRAAYMEIVAAQTECLVQLHAGRGSALCAVLELSGERVRVAERTPRYVPGFFAAWYAVDANHAVDLAGIVNGDAERDRALLEVARAACSHSDFETHDKCVRAIGSAHMRLRATVRASQASIDGGDVQRAEGYLLAARRHADGIADDALFVEALVEIAELTIGAGRPDAVAEILHVAEVRCIRIANADTRARSLIALAEVSVRAGGQRSALRLLRKASRLAANVADGRRGLFHSISEASAQAGTVRQGRGRSHKATPRGARAPSRSSGPRGAWLQEHDSYDIDLDGLVCTARGLRDERARVQSLVHAAGCALDQQQLDRAAALIHEAERAAGSVQERAQRVEACISVADALLSMGQLERAIPLLDMAADCSFSAPDATTRAVEAAIQRAEQYSRRRTRPGAVGRPEGTVEKLVSSASWALVDGDLERARRATERAMSVLDQLTDPPARARWTVALARIAIGIGAYDHARALLSRTDIAEGGGSDGLARLRALASISVASHIGGCVCRGLPDATEAETDDSDGLASLVCDLFIENGLPAQALGAALRVGDAGARASLLAKVAGAQRDSGSPDVARATLEQAEEAALQAGPRSVRARVLAEISVAASNAGETAAARRTAAHAARLVPRLRETLELAHTAALVSDAECAAGRQQRARDLLARVLEGLAGTEDVEALTCVAAAFARAGASRRAKDLVLTAERLVRQSPGDLTDRYRFGIAEAHFALGSIERGRVLVMREIGDVYWQSAGLAALVDALVGVSSITEAQQIATAVADPLWRVRALSRVREACAAQGDQERAASLGASIHAAAALIEDGFERVRWTLASTPVERRLDSVVTVISGPYWFEALPQIAFRARRLAEAEGGQEPPR